MAVDQIITETVETSSAEAAVSLFLARPAAPGQHPAILIIHEWWGLNDHIKDIAQKFARAGFAAAAVDLYDGVVTRDAAEAGKLMSSLDPKKALAKLNAAINHLRSANFVSAVGVTGFCMGGVYTLLSACNFRVDAAVAFYGIPDDLSPIEKLSCPLLFIGGELDKWITVEKMQRLDAELQKHHKEAEVKIYAGADHAFFNDTRPEVYSEKDAKDAWQHTLEFFSRHLKRGQTAGA